MKIMTVETACPVAEKTRGQLMILTFVMPGLRGKIGHFTTLDETDSRNFENVYISWLINPKTLP